MRDEVRCLTASFSKQRTSEKARLGEVGKGGFESRVKDEDTGNAGVECVIFEILTAGEAGPTA
jgi:hypothetical protein